MLFLGACGKSAQLPLYLWLPDAMEGPTPVSALIHAATMVTAGVYLMTRINPITSVAFDWAPTVIAIIGVATALFAATIAVAQNDIKKVLAYSTVSQLGYMFLAIGSGAYVRGRVPHDHARVLQGAAVPRRRIRDPRHARRAGHAPDGRAAQVHARHRVHVHRRLAGDRRRAAVLRVLVEGRDPAVRLRQESRALRRRARHRAVDRVLHDPPGDDGVLRRGPLGRPRRGARRPRRLQAPRVVVDHARPTRRSSPAWRSSAACSNCRSTTTPSCSSAGSSR